MLGSNPQFSVAVLINGIDYYNNKTNLTTFNVQFSVGSTSDSSAIALSHNQIILYSFLISFCVLIHYILQRPKKHPKNIKTSSDQHMVSPELLLP